MKKLLIVFCCISLLISDIPAFQFKAGAEDEKIVNLTSDSVFIEAEDADIDDSFHIIEDADASGGKYILSQTNNKFVYVDRYELNKYFKTHKVPLTLKINAANSGYYVVYLRVLTSKGQGNFYQRFNQNGDLTMVSAAKGTLSNEDKYSWITMSSYRFNEGINTIEFCYRQDIAIDKIVISKNAVDKPEGMGENLCGFHFKDEVEDTSYLYDIPTIVPNSERPRLLIRKDTINTVKANLSHERNLGVYNKLLQSAEKDYDCKLNLTSTGADNTNINYLNYIEANAFLYAINKNEENAAKAINGLLNYLSTYDTPSGGTTASRKVGYMAFIAGLVYDWCYDALTVSQREEIVNNIIFNFKRTEMHWPPLQNAGFSHGEETIIPYMLSFGIAVYGDYSEIYNIVFGKVLKESIPTRNIRYRESNYNLEGEFYSAIRSGSDWFLYLMLHELGCRDLITENIRYQPYTYTFRNSPSGAYLRDGDGAAYPLIKSSGGGIAPFLSASLFDDSYMLSEFYRFYNNGTFETGDPAVNMTMFLAFNKVDLPMKQRDELPLSYYTGDDAGMMTARTSWDEGVYSNTMIASFKTPERYMASHSHRDSGHFYIYYKGPLALDSGVYTGLAYYDENGEYITNIGSGSTHNAAYAKQTIAHNSLLIYNPDEDTGDIPNNGGQYPESPIDLDPEKYDERSQGFGEVLDADFGPDPNTPSYTYLKGDITNAYKGKAEEYTRSFMFLNFFDEIYPGALIVFDNVISSDESFKKTWLLHTQEEPEIKENIATAVNTLSGYNGRITNETLLPEAEDLSITKIGGEGLEYPDINGVNQKAVPQREDNDESGKWRVEISTKTEKKHDMFLNVLTATENNSNIPELKSEYIKGEDFAGVKIRNKAVFFSKYKERYEKDFTLTVNGDEKEIDFYVAGVKAGEWEVYKNDELIGTLASKDKGGAITFSAQPGTYTLRYKENSDVILSDFNFLNHTQTKEAKTKIVYNNVFDSTIKSKKINGNVYLSLYDLIKRIEESDFYVKKDDKTFIAEFYQGTSYLRRIACTDGSDKIEVTNIGLGNISKQRKTVAQPVIKDENDEFYISADSVINTIFSGYTNYDSVADVVRVTGGKKLVGFDGVLNVSHNNCGTVYPDESIVFRKNKDKFSVYAKPDEGYVVKSIKINGEEKLTASTDKAVTVSVGVLNADASVNVEFEPKIKAVLKEVSYNGKVKNDDDKSYTVFFTEIEGDSLSLADKFGVEINGKEYFLEETKNSLVFKYGSYGVGITQSINNSDYNVRPFYYVNGQKFYGDYCTYAK